jgi:hypothetical protein
MPRIRIIGKKYAPAHESGAVSGGRETRRSSSATRNFARRSERSAPTGSAGGGMDWPRGTLSACCCASTASAQSASKSLARRFASITVTPPGRCADCFAARATWDLGASMTIPGCCGGRPRTWKTGGGRQTRSRPSLHGSRLPSPWRAVSLTASRPDGAGRRSSPVQDLGRATAAMSRRIPDRGHAELSRCPRLQARGTRDSDRFSRPGLSRCPLL